MIIFSDLHLEPKSAETALEVLRRIPDVCRARKDKHVAFLGDFWMVRHTLPVKLALDARDIMRSWFTSGAVDRFDVLVGNHDQIDLDGRNALEVFDDLGHGTVVHTEPGWTPAGFWLPYRHTHDEIREILRAATATARNEPPVLFAHIGLLGAWMNNTKRDDFGFPASEIVDLGFKRVFCGHYHRHNMVQKGVLYVGSPYQVSYAEADQEKGVLSWDGQRSEFIPWEVGARHYKVVFDADHPAALEMPRVRPGDKLWVVVKGQMAGAAQKAVQDNLTALGITPARIDVDLQPELAAARIDIRPEETRAQLAARYVAAQDIPEDYRALLLTTLATVTKAP